MSMEKLGAFVGGALFATVGAKILASKDAQKVYVYTTAAALREKEDVMSVVTNIKEIAGDVLAGAKGIQRKARGRTRPWSLRMRQRRLSKHEMHDPA